MWYSKCHWYDHSWALADAGSLSGSSNTLGTGQTVQLSSSGSAGGTWSSDDTDVATVNSSGLVTAAGVGTTTLNTRLQEQMVAQMT